MIEIASSILSVEIMPEIGGKVGQIRDRRTGREFLVPPQKPYRTIAPYGDWLQHDTSGMDDCFPNVAAGMYPEAPWSSVHLPDLGEWTHGLWDVTTVSEREIKMSRTGTALPYEAVKTVRFLGEETLEFAYQVTNNGQTPIRYLWSAHPLIAVEGEYTLGLPRGPLDLRTFPANGQTYSWPACKGTDLSCEWIPHGTTRKVFVTGMPEGWCVLRLATHTLRFSFNIHTLPVLGVWFNNFGFPSESRKKFRCIAVEPCTSPTDLLDELATGDYPYIPAAETVEWSMQLNISPHEES